MHIAGKTALVTGATGLLGRQLAHQLAARDARLLLTARRRDDLNDLARQLGGEAIVADLATRAGVESLMRQAGDVDIVVANAALMPFGLMPADFTADEVDYLLDLNLRCQVHLAHLATEQMASRGGGHFVFVLSLAAKYASRRASLYNCAKFGLRGFSRALREDLRPLDVGVSSVLPGFIRSPESNRPEVKLPWWTGGSSSAQHIARATMRAVERNRGEIIVAPPGMRIIATLTAAFPERANAVHRRLHHDSITQALHAGGQVHR
ncbi:SDR family NAD(P)-dependent oxidoreductase [Embleya sp. NPDC059237]|uniref:SDR family NAD(P)-dependent oxidoreductase n=1 Tax=Embleya sp. NPDC059237 TaxID=3346784 RepID=UPI0036C62DE3